MDTADFEIFGSEAPGLDPEDYTPQTKRMEQTGSRLARYVRLELSQFNGGEIPEWHLGRWNPTWVFADEFEFDAEPVP